MIKVFAEMGIGNDTFLSTEIEEGLKEYRISRFSLPENIEEYYLRFWIGKFVFVFSTREGVKMRKKVENNLKILFGVGGTSARYP